ncbi:MAG: hypothetical protein UY92_C0004G0056 [Candidatus Magasanikbacteria bacterium GW2011_GWA2_56_11]|uniref:Uncharacterized protein n=1 Tax=Candidatus Magasanikbacteria bacterium GW2011_GWA2_56_11 TaxID=1619044 RepID=A0A0G1YHQ0_9BACT|nr:MAG: hypothetical protein UY92_C0004G0056 [Candidatus Magasanikbacteria bacterium GW2011_GWA2_56_11]
MPLSGAQFVVSGKVDYKCIVMAGSEPELQDKKDLNIIYFVTDPKYGPEMEKGWATLVPKGFYGDLAYDQDAIDWEGATEIKVDFGAVKEITVFAEEDGAGTSGEVKIECLDCNKDWSGFKTEKIEGGETKAVIKVDTGAYYEKMGVELPAKFTVKLKGTVGSKKGPRYSFFEFSITINKFNCAEKKTGSDCNKNTQCFFFENICQSKYDKNICKQLPQTLCAPAPGGSKVCTWNEATKQCLEPVATSIAESYGVPDGYKGPLPPCAFSGTCDNINILLNLFIAQGKGIFGLIGVVALGAFVYGGFMMIFSLGSSERVETGRKAMTAAVVGLIISFSAYILVDFVLDALKVSDSFKVIK